MDALVFLLLASYFSGTWFPCSLQIKAEFAGPLAARALTVPHSGRAIPRGCEGRATSSRLCLQIKAEFASPLATRALTVPHSGRAISPCLLGP